MTIKILLTALILFTIAFAITLYAYIIAFHAPKHLAEKQYELPQGKQYEPHHPSIQKCIEEMLVIPYEEVYITGFDGVKLFGRYYHVNDNAPVQIQFHGYKSSAYRDFCGGNKLARKLGHNTLVVDQRSHGKSEGNTITFGIKERRDCLSWIQYICERFGNDTPIILCGLSMGAATVLMATDLELPPNIKGIIADCPYSSPKAIIQKVCKDMHLPPKLLYPFVKLGACLLAGFNLEESDAVSAVKNTSIPILIIHGDDDRFVPYYMSEEIAKANSSVIFETISTAGHGLCYMVEPKKYEDVTVKFIQGILC